MTRRRAYALVIAVCALPRLGVLLHERGDILSAFTEKSWRFANVFLDTGTFGFIGGTPSANTQPLYAFFLIPIIWVFDQSWLAVGLAQICVAVATALLVYEIGRRVTSPGWAVVAAAIATLQPYLVWHDVHLNREILDQLLAAALVLCVLVAADRRSLTWSVGAGICAGLAILGNVRLSALPLVLAAYLLLRNGWSWAPVALVAAAAVTVTPWVVRNKVQVGCFALTTDGRALWKANNLQTYGLLTHGKWIDDVKDPPGHPFPNPEEARVIYARGGGTFHIDECANESYYQHKAWLFVRNHPGAKAKLAGLGVRMLWDPRTTASATDSGHGLLRTWAQPLYMSVLYLLALIGLFFAPRRFTLLAVLILAYQTLAAVVFVGATRYRISTDFLLALLAAAVFERIHTRA